MYVDSTVKNDTSHILFSLRKKRAIKNINMEYRGFHPLINDLSYFRIIFLRMD